jgi:hypothetical protein
MNFMVVTRAEVDSHRRFGVCTFNSRTRELSLRPCRELENALGVSTASLPIEYGNFNLDRQKSCLEESF